MKLRFEISEQSQGQGKRYRLRLPQEKCNFAETNIPLRILNRRRKRNFGLHTETWLLPLAVHQRDDLVHARAISHEITEFRLLRQLSLLCQYRNRFIFAN